MLNADSPAARHLDALSAESQPLARPTFERLLRAQGERARRQLAAAAERCGASHSFRVVRGAVGEELRQAAVESDLVAVGRAGWRRLSQRGLGSTPRALVDRPGGLLLVLPARARAPRSIGLLYDGGAAAPRALALALELARANALPLRVVVPLDLADLAAAEAEVGAALEAARLPARLERQPSADLASALAPVEERAASLVVLPRADSAEATLDLLEQLLVPVLIVGGSGADTETAR